MLFHAVVLGSLLVAAASAARSAAEEQAAIDAFMDRVYAHPAAAPRSLDKRQVTVGCKEDNMGQSTCCVTLPRFQQQQLCGVFDFEEQQEDVKVQVTFANIPVFQKTFTNLTTHFCTKFLGGNVCLKLSDESISRSGACGCVNAAIDLFGDNANTAPMNKVGCFAFGNACYESNCADYSYDCHSCAVLTGCGYCSSTQSCMSGTSSGGAYNGACPRTQFHFDPKTC